MQIKVRTILSLLFICNLLSAQDDVQMITSWYNRASYNPAYIAQTEYMYIFSNIRQQWTGIEGAPLTGNLQVSEYVHALRSAFGLSLSHDRLGLVQSTNAMLNYAHLLKVGKQSSLSLGLSMGYYLQELNGLKFDPEDFVDNSIQYDVIDKKMPDANIGIELRTKYFITGISSKHLFTLFNPDDSYFINNQRYGYFIFKNNNNQHFYYRLGLLAANNYAKTIYEANAFIRLKHATGLQKGPREIFDFGFSYRSSRQIALMMGILIRPDLRLGYGYEFSYIPGYYPNNTHEIMLEYRIPNKLATTKNACIKFE